MSEMSGKYRQIITDLENGIKDEETLEFVKEKFADMSMMFIDMIDRITAMTDKRIEQIEEKQNEINAKINSVQSAVDGIESDIYEADDSNYEFEIVCPYCNYEFTTDIEDENKEEIICPECHNTIELDWNQDDFDECTGSCHSCHSHCGVAEDEEEYTIDSSEDINQKDNEEDEDM